MKISIIGTGNVATVLSKLMFAKNHSILQVYGRNIDSATVLANEVNAQAISILDELNNNADIYLIAIADKSIENLCKQINVDNKIVLHTAGSVSKNILQNCSSNYGILYPVQSLRKSMDINASIPFLIDANNEETKNKIEIFAKSISNKVEFGDDDKRLKLHAAAVFACNFVNYMYLQSANFCQENNIDFSLLQPLIEETATRLRTSHPSEVFTGPAVRKDFETIEKHLQQLSSNPNAQSLYKQISDMIMNSV